MVHCRLQPGQTSRAVRHHRVEGSWYVLHGLGKLWRRQEGHEQIVALLLATAHTIPLRTRFQFRSIGDKPPEIIIVTLPPRPGEENARCVQDHGPIEADLSSMEDEG